MKASLLLILRWKKSGIALLTNTTISYGSSSIFTKSIVSINIDSIHERTSANRLLKGLWIILPLPIPDKTSISMSKTFQLGALLSKVKDVIKRLPHRSMATYVIQKTYLPAVGLILRRWSSLYSTFQTWIGLKPYDVHNDVNERRKMCSNSDVLHKTNAI